MSLVEQPLTSASCEARLHSAGLNNDHHNNRINQHVQNIFTTQCVSVSDISSQETNILGWNISHWRIRGMAGRTGEIDQHH